MKQVLEKPIQASKAEPLIKPTWLSSDPAYDLWKEPYFWPLKAWQYRPPDMPKKERNKTRKSTHSMLFANPVRSVEESKTCQDLDKELCVGPCGQSTRYTCRIKNFIRSDSGSMRVWVKRTCVKCKRFRPPQQLLRMVVLPQLEDFL